MANLLVFLLEKSNVTILDVLLEVPKHLTYVLIYYFCAIKTICGYCTYIKLSEIYTYTLS